MDGRTGDVVPEKVVLLLENGFAVWGFRIFLVVIFTYWRQQGRRTTESYYRFWACSARPPLADVECQVWW
jgi:hypothetical protein